jgi:monoamine oxidase
MVYDICIIGAGIAGLYCARELSKKYPNAKICILEKFNQIGGRTYTYHTTVNGLDVSWEAGAGRIHKSHHNVMALLKEYGIDTIPISGEIEWRTPEGSEPIHFSKLLSNSEISRLPEKTLESKTLKELFTEIMGIQKAREFLNMYEYRSEIDTLKASKALESLKHEIGQTEGFSVLKGGFSLLIKKLKESIPNVKILMEHEVLDIKKNDTYSLILKNKEIKCFKVIVSIPRDAVSKIPCFKGLPILEQVKMRPLVRMYAVFPLQNGQAWFAGINKFLCDLPIRYVIPIDPSKGIIMISYTDGPEAEYWMKHNNPLNEVMSQIRSLFPAVKIPDPLFFKVHPWSDGCSYWVPDPNGPYDFNHVSKASVKPLPHMPELYMCGESWAYEQCWVKCAIDQAQKVIHLI